MSQQSDINFLEPLATNRQRLFPCPARRQTTQLSGSVSYSIRSGNTLLENAADSSDMKNQAEGKKQKVNTWTVVRSYQSKFSYAEAVERLIKIHSVTKEK